MAGETRPPPRNQPEDLSHEALTINPDNKPFTGQQWQDDKATPRKPPENANLMAGGTQHTAGGQVPAVTFWNALQTGPPITEIHKRPCVRDALMTGIGAAFATGGVRAIFGATVWSACNWAVTTMCVGSGAMYQYCLWKRQAEKEGMMRAVEILNRKEVEKRAREQHKEKAREERRQAKDKEQDVQLTALRESREGNLNSGGKPWWKVW